MHSETRNCQNCKQDFTILPDDFSFYAKIKVPPPTFCPECRAMRRMAWRNVRSLYRRECSLCKKVLISMYADDGVSVMCVDCWHGDNWDPFEYQQELDFQKPFFEQVNTIFKKQPRLFQYRVGGTIINCDYANSIANSKNIYLAFSILNCENISFSENVDNSRDSIDCLCSRELDSCYWNVDSEANYNSHFQVQSQKNIDSWFLYDCANCQNCCLSSNLRNQSYVFRNKKLSKEEYKIQVEKLRLNTYSGLLQAKQEFLNLKQNSIHRFAQIYNSTNASGDLIFNSNQIVNSFDITNGENVSNVYRAIKCRDLKDCTWVLEGELQYESMSGSGSSSNQIGCIVCFGSQYIEYSMFCRNTKNCFGCVGLKNAQYCILNKQYAKEEYEILVPKIKQYMMDNPYVDNHGKVYRYGEFFPFSFSPFGYNETVSHDYFPLTKEQADSFECNWNQREKKDYTVTVTAHDLIDSIEEIDTSILDEVIACPNNGNYLSQCTSAFKITGDELDFYKNKGLPLPRFCPNCRHYERISWRNPIKLWHRTCSYEGCMNEFETTYAPDRPEKVYCERCYQKEVL